MRVLNRPDAERAGRAHLVSILVVLDAGPQHVCARVCARDVYLFQSLLFWMRVLNSNGFADLQENVRVSILVVLDAGPQPATPPW